MVLDVGLPLFPVVAAGAVDEDDGHGDGFSGLDEGENFKALVHGAETAGEKGDGVAGADEDEFSGEEVFEVDEFFIVGDEGVGFLFEGETDGQAEAGIGACAAVTRGHDAAAGAGDDHPSGGGHFFGELGGLNVILMGFGGSGGAEDADFSDIAIGGEDFECVAEFLEGFVDEFYVAAIGLIAEELHGVVDDFADHVAVGDNAELFDEFLREGGDAGEIGAADDERGLGGFLGLF